MGQDKLGQLRRRVAELKATEAAHQRLEVRYRTFLETADLIVILMDPVGHYLYVNPHIERWTGYPPEAFYADIRIGQHILHPDDFEVASRAFHRAAEEGEGQRFEFRWRPKGGESFRWALEQIFPVRDPSGAIDSVLAVIQDITERKEAEEALRKRESRYRKVVDSAPVAILGLDLQGHVTDWSKGAQLMFGWSAEEALGRFCPTVPEDGRDEYLAMIARTVNQGAQTGMVYYRQKKNGELICANITSAPLSDAAGNTAGVMVILEDITARKQAEGALLENTRRLKLLLDLARNIASTLDLDILLKEVFEQIASIFPSLDLAILYLWDPREKALVPKRWQGYGAQAIAQLRLLPGEFISGKVFQSGQAILARNPEEVLALRGELRPENMRFLTAALRGWQVKSSICAPLRTRVGKVLGTLSLSSPRQVFTEMDLELLEGVASQLAQAIGNAQLHTQTREFTQRLVQAQEEERRRVARELHDQVGQYLTGLKLTLELCEQLPSDATRQKLHEGLELVALLMSQVQDLSLDLRLPVLEELGLIPALLWHFERYTAQTQVRVVFKHAGLNCRLPSVIENSGFRIVQEALNNVARHAKVEEVEVRVWGDVDTLRVQVEDQGRGFDPEVVLAANTTSGLKGMQERALLLGGQLIIESRPGGGTCITGLLLLNRPVGELQGEQGT